MFKQTMIAAAALTAVAWASPAGAENYVTLGRLVCGSDGGQGLIVTSQKSLICTYTSAAGGAKAVYAGKIEKFGLDIGQTGKSVMIWQVLAKTARISRNSPLPANITGSAPMRASVRAPAPRSSPAAPTRPSCCSR